MWSQYVQLTNKNKNQAEKTLYSTLLSTKLKVGDSSLHQMFSIKYTYLI